MEEVKTSPLKAARPKGALANVSVTHAEPVVPGAAAEAPRSAPGLAWPAAEVVAEAAKSGILRVFRRRLVGRGWPAPVPCDTAVKGLARVAAVVLPTAEVLEAPTRPPRAEVAEDGIAREAIAC